jgi:hypothetical protein
VGEGQAVEHVEDLAARVERLERSNRRLKLALPLAIVAVALAVLGLRRVKPVLETPGTVEARRFVLLDSRGVQRAVLETAESGGPQLLLTDAEGDVELALFAVPGGVRGLALHDGQALRAALTATPGGSATLAMEANDRVAGGSLTLTSAGAEMGVWGAGGRVTATAPADPDKAARVETHDGDEGLTGQLPPSNEPFGWPGTIRPVRAALIGPAR